MNIGVFGARSIPSTYSGYETFLTRLLPELVKRGHRVTMFCRARSFGKPHVYEGVRLVPIPAIDTTRLSTLSHGLVSAVASRAGRFDVVLVMNVANVPYCLLNRLSGQRIVMNTDGQEWLRGKWGTGAKRYFKLCARWAGSSASALVSDSDGMRRIYAEQFGATSTVIPYAAVAWPETCGSPAVLSPFGVEPGRFVVVAARLNPENHVAEIVRAFSRSSLPIPLLVLGVANYASEAAEQIRADAARDDRIRPIGHVGDRLVFGALLKEAAAYVHGHSVGGMNPSLVEAMSAGALVFALSTTFNHEVLGDAGLYFDLESDALVRLFDRLEHFDRTAGTKLRRAAAARASKRYSMHDVASSYELLLAKTAGLDSSRGTTRVVTPWDASADLEI